MSDTETRETCDTLVIRDGEEQPCDRPATGWRWYGGGDHGPVSWPACSIHENVGGNRMHAAEAELSCLRGVVEAAQDLAHKWEMFAVACEPEDPATRPRLSFDAAAERLRAALAPVSSSGEAESGEAKHVQTAADCRAGGPGAPISSGLHCEVCNPTPAPIPSGGQADGEGDEKLATLNRATDVALKVWSQAVAEGIEASPETHVMAMMAALWEAGLFTAHPILGREDAERVLDAMSAARAARPVLSREALRERLDDHWPGDETWCDCGWVPDVVPDEVGDDWAPVARGIWLDHLADVLHPQDGGQR